MDNAKRYQLRYAAGVYWLLDMEQPGLPYRKPMRFNACGAYIWERCMEGMQEQEIVQLLQKDYGITQEMAEEDVGLFLSQLKTQGLL